MISNTFFVATLPMRSDGKLKNVEKLWNKTCNSNGMPTFVKATRSDNRSPESDIHVLWLHQI